VSADVRAPGWRRRALPYMVMTFVLAGLVAGLLAWKLDWSPWSAAVIVGGGFLLNMTFPNRLRLYILRLHGLGEDGTPDPWPRWYVRVAPTMWIIGQAVIGVALLVVVGFVLFA